MSIGVIEKFEQKTLNFFSALERIITVFLSATMMIGVLLVIIIYLIFFIQGKMNSSQIPTDILVLTFIFAMSMYILPIGLKANNYFKTDKTEKILKEMSELKKINGIFDKYVSITEPELFEFKEKVIRVADNSLDELITQKHTLTVQEGHDWSIPIIKKLQPGDEVKAVSFLRDDRGEWDESSSTSWGLYLEANLIAARNCKSVKRLIIANKTKLIECLNQEEDNTVKKHIDAQHRQPEYDLIFVDKSNLEKHYGSLFDAMKEGFILINLKGKKKIAVMDFFKETAEGERKYKVQINCKENEVDNIYKSFESICDKCKESPELLKIDINSLKASLENSVQK